MMKKCNHRISSKKTSIVLLSNIQTFTFPQHIHGVCECCGKSFDYIKDENGKLIIYNNNDKEKGKC